MEFVQKDNNGHFWKFGDLDSYSEDMLLWGKRLKSGEITRPCRALQSGAENNCETSLLLSYSGSCAL